MIQQQASASVHAVSHLKLTRLLQYYASLQNGLALMDAANGISLVGDYDDAQDHDDEDAALPSDEVFAPRDSNGFSRDAFDLAGGDSSPGPALDLVALSEPHTVEQHKRKLDALLQELALLPGTTVADVDARLAEAEEAFLETLQRIQTDVAKGEIASTVSSFAGAAATTAEARAAAQEPSALHWRDREEIQERRLYLHKLMEVHELLTASDDALARKKLSKVLSPKKLRSTRPPATVAASKKPKKTPRGGAAVRRPTPQATKPPMSFALPSSAASAALSASQRRATVAPAAFQPSLDLVPPITAEKLQQSARRAAEYQAIAEEEARQQQRRQDEQRRYSEWMSPRPTATRSPHTSPSPTTVHRRVPSAAFAAAASPTSSPEPMRADSLSPSSSLSPVAGLALHRSQSPTLPRPSSASPPSARLQRPTSPLLFTSPAPPRVYQSPFLSPNVHQAATTKAAAAAASSSSPPSWASPIAPQLTASMLSTGDPGSPSVLQSPSPSQSRVVLASSTAATPSTPFTALYVSSSAAHPSPGSPLRSPLPAAAAHTSTAHTPLPPAPPAAPSSSPTLRRFASPSSSSRSPVAMAPATPAATSTASVTYAPSTRATSSATKPLLRATKSFTEKDAETLAALLDGLNLNRYASRAELDHALHVKQTELHDALTQGRGADVVAKIKTQMESMRAAYRLVALRG